MRWVLAVVTVAAVFALAFGLYLRRDANPGCQSGSACTRIFFIGNSYTSTNDLPTMFADLAWSGGHRVETATQAPGGWTLADHDRAAQTESTLNSSKWNLVILQEQSEIPAVESLREAYMYPAAEDLADKARLAGAQPLFFITWAHRNGWPAQSLPDYPTMQAAIDDGYTTIARRQHAKVAPVGLAWMSQVAQGRGSGLWQDDGSHPTEEGTYLAACVFYASIFLESPAGLTYRSGLSSADAASAQNVAAATVLDDPAKWGLS